MNGDKKIREQLGSVQVRFDKEAAWDRLHERLETKAANKTYYRLGWVPASLIMLACILWQASPINEQPVASQGRRKMATPNNNERLTITSASAIVETEEDHIVTSSVAEKHKNYDTGNNMTVEKPEVQQPIVVEVIQEQAVVEKEAPIAIARPKMKVVHINEVIEEERVERKVLNSRYADNKHYDRYYYRLPEENSGEFRNPFKIYISTKN